MEELKKNRLPILFAHGKGDTIVPYEMSVENYNAAREVCDATLFSVDKADHGMSYFTDRENYLAQVKKLIEKCTGDGTDRNV